MNRWHSTVRQTVHQLALRASRAADPPGSAAAAIALTLVLLQVLHALLQRVVVAEVDMLAGAVRAKGVELARAHQAHLRCDCSKADG